MAESAPQIQFRGSKSSNKRKADCKGKKGMRWDASVDACVPSRKTIIERFGK